MFFSSLNQHYDIIICVYWFKLISQVSDVAHGPLVFIKYLFKNNISTMISVLTDEISLITFHTIMCKNALVLSTTWLKTHDINIHNTSLSYESLELILTVTVPQIQVLFFLHGKTCVGIAEVTVIGFFFFFIFFWWHHAFFTWHFLFT